VKEKLNIVKAIIYPERCPVCEKIHTIGKQGFCKNCENKLSIISEPVCAGCGRKVEEFEYYCTDCKKQKHEFDGGRFLFSYEQMAASVYRFKYMNRPEYARTYAKAIYDNLNDWIDIINPDAFIAVPLNKKRLIKRGYNQAAELSIELSKLTGIPVKNELVGRIKNTEPQKLFDRPGRQNNMKKAFIVYENVVKLGTVVLVDDIFTTGSTLDSLTHELKLAGVKKVYFITLTAAGT